MKLYRMILGLVFRVSLSITAGSILLGLLVPDIEFLAILILLTNCNLMNEIEMIKDKEVKK